jgi:predicted MFS family arabinose efflux permease
LSVSPKHSSFHLFLPFAVAYYLSYLLRNGNAVIAPVLTQELALTAADLGLLTSAYFLAFGLFQVPLGMLLDRYGARRVEATLLLFAAAGTLVFAFGRNIGELAIGRALIGLGVSACLMAGLKNFSQWYPAERQASLTGAIMVAGGLGAISATIPLEAMLPAIGWRGVFLVLTGIIVVATIYLFVAVPDHDHGVSRTSLRQQWQGVVEVFASRSFWRFAPQTALFSGGFMAVHGLWAVPWFIEVDGLTRAESARSLFAIGVAALASYLAIALWATSLIRRGVRATRMLGGLLAVGWLFQLGILAGVVPALPLWIGYGFCMTATQLSYASLTQRFALALSGRVITALNLLAFAGAFAIQWGIGGVVDLLAAAGWGPAPAFRAAFALMAAAQLLALGWFVLEGRREKSVRLHAPLPPAGP